MPETKSISLPITLVNKMLDIIQKQPYREVGGVMQEIGAWQAAQQSAVDESGALEEGG